VCVCACARARACVCGGGGARARAYERALGVPLQTKGEEKAKKLILDIRNKRHKIILCCDSILQAENLCSVNTVIRYDYNTE
jgi:hypothetical protein